MIHEGHGYVHLQAIAPLAIKGSSRPELLGFASGDFKG
jgi:hypothetical protein